jgi:hypothetical protein
MDGVRLPSVAQDQILLSGVLLSAPSDERTSLTHACSCCLSLAGQSHLPSRNSSDDFALRDRMLLATEVRVKAKAILRPTTSRQVYPGSGHHLGPPTNFRFFSMEIIFRYLIISYYGAPSLTRECMYNLQLRVWLSTLVFLVSESRVTHEYI